MASLSIRKFLKHTDYINSISHLTDREKFVIGQRLSRDPLWKTGKMMSICGEQVRRIEKKAIRKLDYWRLRDKHE